MLTEVAGDRVSYRVEVRGGAERLSRALRFNGLIEQESPRPDCWTQILLSSTYSP